MQNTNAWAQSIVDKLSRSLRKIQKLEAKITRYDRAPEWRRILMGGMIFRSLLEVRLMIAEDAYFNLTLSVREERDTVNTKQNA
ncbi:hypothetical protein [Runella sp. SP2]|uniref:hypothetical protein n=1 Tax=Runella sp. SP2 TaxID=2268026 RepID=UPI000F098199|nr:hypothetical protein [Runella sp. SP2]AYQ31411.1 hypothetical protein DTQ70_04100 [Runella sp. SP2]